MMGGGSRKKADKGRMTVGPDAFADVMQELAVQMESAPGELC